MLIVRPWNVPPAPANVAAAVSAPSGRLPAGTVADQVPPPSVAGTVVPPTLSVTPLTFGSEVPVIVNTLPTLAALIVLVLAPVTASLPSDAPQPGTGPGVPG